MPETAFEDQVRETLRSQAETPMLWAGDPVVVSDRARRRLFRNVAASVAVGILVAVIVISSLPMGERSIPAHPPGPAVPRGDGKIAFAQGRDLYVIDSNGNEKTLVAQGCTGETCAIWSVAWSPQGTELVFAYYSEKNSTLGPRDGPLYLVRPDGSGLTALTDCRWPNCHDYAAAWSPDGRRIAFVRRGGQDGAGVVYVVASDGSNLVPISSRGVAPVPPTWSPDGSRIAYVADYPRGRTRIEVAAADGSGHSILVDGSPAGDPYYPSWSPSGEKLAYSSSSGIWVVGTDGGSPERVLKSRGLPVWSPDGTRLAVATSSGLVVMDPDGTLRIVLAAGRCWGVVWSPSGNMLAFSTAHQMVVVSADGSDRRILTGSGVSMIAWQAIAR